MTNLTAFRALFLAAGLTVAAPGLSMAADLLDGVTNASANNTPAIGSPFAHAMATTRAAEHGLPGNVGGSASATGNPLATPVSTSVAHGPRGRIPGPVGNSASAQDSTPFAG